MELNDCCVLTDDIRSMPMSMLASCMMVVERTDDPQIYIIRKNKYKRGSNLKGEVSLDLLNVYLTANNIKLEVIDELKTT
jgi:hypothetical protein